MRRVLTGALTVLLALLLGAAPTAADPRPGGGGQAARNLQVLSHNVYLLPPIAGAVGNQTRAELIARADYTRGHDVVVLQELFDNGPSETLLAGLAGEYPHRTPVLGRSTRGWDQTLGAFSWLTPEDGGVAVLSKWPIRRQVQYVYADGCGADWFSNKGFVYVQLDVDGVPVHVVGTHAQATDPLCADAAAVRRAQFAELDRFLDGLRISSDQQVVIAGDLNVDRTSAEYADLRAGLDVVDPAYAGHPFSWDPGSNSLAAAKYPGYPGEHLDYVLFRRENQGRAWTNTTLTPVSPTWTSGGQEYDDYSDHYPVVAR